jgi:hypothetical protein
MQVQPTELHRRTQLSLAAVAPAAVTPAVASPGFPAGAAAVLADLFAGLCCCWPAIATLLLLLLLPLLLLLLPVVPPVQ